jgi:hypothetical protein
MEPPPFILFKGTFVKALWFDDTSQLLSFGAAISFGLRQLFTPAGMAFHASGYVFVFAHLAGSLILCRAFWPNFGYRGVGTLSQTPTPH